MNNNRDDARLRLQAELDAQKTQDDRNKLGQFATPSSLALQIVRRAVSLLPPSESIRFLDPAFGTGSFFAALLNSVQESAIARAMGFEIDPHYGEPAKKLWQGTGLKLRILDFASTKPPTTNAGKSNVLICNPPYVRHHHLTTDEKKTLQQLTFDRTGIALNGLSGLYCYFLLASHCWMSQGGVGVWLIPGEFMDVNYGSQVKQYLLNNVTLQQIHRFDPSKVQFKDVLVSSAIVIFRNSPTPTNHSIRFSLGGSLENPSVTSIISAEQLRGERKWTRYPNYRETTTQSSTTLGDIFVIKRGLATGANSYFILTKERTDELELPGKWLMPILPSPRHLDVDEIPAYRTGEPRIARRLFLLSCNLELADVERTYPKLAAYLHQGTEDGIPQGYLCSHRYPWYSQEDKPPAPFLCTYMGRNGNSKATPFRFILNHSKATAANVYLLLYPKPELQQILGSDKVKHRAVWQALSSIGTEHLTDEGRVYGGGLYKLEPKELSRVSADVILESLDTDLVLKSQRTLFLTS